MKLFEKKNVPYGIAAYGIAFFAWRKKSTIMLENLEWKFLCFFSLNRATKCHMAIFNAFSCMMMWTFFDSTAVRYYGIRYCCVCRDKMPQPLLHFFQQPSPVQRRQKCRRVVAPTRTLRKNYNERLGRFRVDLVSVWKSYKHTFKHRYKFTL